MCLSVCVIFPHDISKSDVARITKRDIEMFHHACVKPINFRIKGSKVKVTKHKNAGVGHGALVSAGFLYSYNIYDDYDELRII